MATTVAPAAYTFNDACPVVWPKASPAMVEYPLLPSITPEPVADFVVRAYLEALWLPESIISLPQLVHSLRRIQATSDTEDHPLRSILRPLLLSLHDIEQKYQQHLPAILNDPLASEREDIQIEESAMWYAWHHGKPSPRHFPDPDNIDQEKWKIQWMADMERREVLVQILLHYLFLSLPGPPQPQSPPPNQSRKRKRKSGKESSPKRKEAAIPTLSHPENLDMLTDRVSIWQAVDPDAEKFLKRPGDEDRDWMRVFCEDTIGTLFGDQVPALYKMFEEKVGPPQSRPSSPEAEQVPAVPKPKTKKDRGHGRKSTLTEADLIPSRPSTSKVNGALSRSRSVSMEPGTNATSRSRSVSLAAEEIKAIGGKRGGIAGNSRLFASEVEMRRKATSTDSLLKRSTSTTNAFGFSKDGPAKSSTESQSTNTLVVETPRKAVKPQVWSLIEDDDVVPDSPELVYLGTVRHSSPESPTKQRKPTKD